MSHNNPTIKDSYVELHKIEGVTLSVMSSQEVEDMSVSRIYDILTYNANGDPVSHGINDDMMGTMDRDRVCKTCMGTQVDCPGHFGHIKLEKPVYHGNLLDYIRKVLKAVCWNCSHLLADHDDHKRELESYIQIKNNKSRFNKVQKLSSSISQCKNCQVKNRKYQRGSLKIEYEIIDNSDQRFNNDSKQTLWPEQAQKILRNITPKHLEWLGLSKQLSDPANMIIENLTVVPPPVRPSVQMIGSTSRSEDDLTVAYKQIIKQNKEIEKAIKNGNTESVINDLRYVLQFYCATLMDNKISGCGTQKHKSGQPLKAIRERLKGKEGRLRGNLMGKRCDFTARSVITCDPNLQLDQLGVPKEIAINMTVPEVVTQQNMYYLRQLVERGAQNWPGAKYIKRLDGRYIDLSMLPNRSDQHLEIGYTVERHLQNNDYVIFNRQPSLHKMSMMGHRIKVLDFQTFRLNLSVTTPYNADFDGDEMNMHVPQSMETKAEIKEIMSVPRQIVAPQKNAPCMGIVQDALLGVHRLTSRDTFVEKHVLMNILMFVDYDLEKGLPQPAILKPKPLWSGKQVISLVIPKITNLESGSDFVKDEALVIQSGELLTGILKKGSVGASPGGLIHIVWKDLGPQACCDILSNIQLVVNNWLVNTGFTVGVQDIIAKPEILNKVKETLKHYKKEVRDIIKKAQNGVLPQQPGKSMFESFEAFINQQLNQARDKAGNIALDALSSENRLKNMVVAGSKGSNMNISQIMACVGQQNVEGQRIKFGFNRRTLPHFAKDDYGPESKGFVKSSYLTGLTPSEFYFHAMGGREGLIDTAVKTADTGYISRRLIKGLEDVMVKYDGTVRTSREVLIQFLYGEDGMAGEHFEKINLELTKLNNVQIADKCDFLHKIESDAAQKKLTQVVGNARAQEIIQDREIRQLFKKEFEQLLQDREVLRTQIMVNGIEDQVIMPVNLPRLITNVKALNNVKTNSVTDLEPRHFFREVNNLIESLVVLPEAREKANIDRSKIIAEANTNSTILFKICLRFYLCSKRIFFEHRLDKQTFDQLMTNIKETFRSAIVHPGEMVGSIAANSIGEPATQMTLNTFHSAGISSKNVTLGVPRLKEVINVAKQLKTPYMKIFLDPSVSKSEEQANIIGAKIQYQNLSHIVSDWGIYFDPYPRNTIIEADRELLELHYLTESMQDQQNDDERNICKWVLRFAISTDSYKVKFDDEHFQFRRDVGAKIDKELNGEMKTSEVIYSDDIMEKKVIRIRPYMPQGEPDTAIIAVLREMAEDFLQNFTLRGFPEVSKISTNKTAQECTRQTFDPVTGAYIQDKGNWIIESDGVALQKVMQVEGVDFKRTVSNSIVETLQVLGIEATRLALINELRMILGTYSIYVDYRHISTLVDMMTLRGILTSITRHGINRVDVGPLRKCTFEETTEILLEAAFFGEYDPLSGISENIIFGQMAPYGTGSFELIIDRHALMNCIEGNMGGGMPAYQESDEYSPELRAMTPTLPGTPMPYMTGAGGATSVYTANPEGDFTPQYRGMMSSPGGPMYSGGESTPGKSPQYQYLNNFAGYQVPGQAQQKATAAYGSTPVYGYAVTPSYVGYGDRNSAAYSPMVPSGASQHQGYSPTNMNPHQTPSYSPTTPNYHHGMTPQQHSTPTYNYGGLTAPNNIYAMPALSSPSMNPASVSPQVSMGSQLGSSVGHIAASFSSQSPGIGGAYVGGQSAYNLQTPAYQNTMAPSVQRMMGVAAAPVAYNPEDAGNQDLSDSDN